MFLRSLLFVPALRLDLFSKAFLSAADALIFDLEDTVALHSKSKALKNITRYFEQFEQHQDIPSQRIFVRINSIDSGLAKSELSALCELQCISGFVVPKVQDLQCIENFSDLLGESEKMFIPIIETPSGVLNCSRIASHKKVLGVSFGSEDYLSETGGNHGLEEYALAFPRNIILLAARQHCKLAIDTVHVKLKDKLDLARNLQISTTLGFDGMLCLSPSEITMVNQAYSPSGDEIRWANEVIKTKYALSDEASQVALVGDGYVGPPVIKRARKILAKAEYFELI